MTELLHLLFLCPGQSQLLKSGALIAVDSNQIHFVTQALACPVCRLIKRFTVDFTVKKYSSSAGFRAVRKAGAFSLDYLRAQRPALA